MTQLFPLPLQGIGTPQVESLASYVLRLASVHGVTPRQLMTAITNVKAPGQLNGYSDFSASIVETVGTLTNQANLANGTLLRFRRVLSANGNDSIVTTRRWCPSCIDGDLQRGEPGYDPLIWSMKAISMCPVHSCWLFSVCSHCMSPQQYLPYRRRLRTHCHRCDRSLGVECDRAPPSSAELWCRAELSDLFALSSESTFKGEPIRVFLEMLIKLTGTGLKPVAREIGFDVRTIRGLIENAKQRPTLATVLRLAASVQQPVELLLSNPLAAAAQGQFAFGVSHDEKPVRRHMSLALRQKLEDALRKAAYSLETNSLPSVASICLTHGVTPGCAHHAFPILVSRIAARRSRCRAERMLDMQNEAKRLVRLELAALSNVEIVEISKKKLVERLMRTSHLPKRALAVALKVAVAKALNEKSFHYDPLVRRVM